MSFSVNHSPETSLVRPEAALNYGYGVMSLESSLTLCPFNKIIAI